VLRTRRSGSFLAAIAAGDSRSGSIGLLASRDGRKSNRIRICFTRYIAQIIDNAR
jgi:hypothetical protein